MKKIILLAFFLFGLTSCNINDSEFRKLKKAINNSINYNGDFSTAQSCENIYYDSVGAKEYIVNLSSNSSYDLDKNKYYLSQIDNYDTFNMDTLIMQYEEDGKLYYVVFYENQTPIKTEILNNQFNYSFYSGIGEVISKVKDREQLSDIIKEILTVHMVGLNPVYANYKAGYDFALKEQNNVVILNSSISYYIENVSYYYQIELTIQDKYISHYKSSLNSLYLSKDFLRYNGGTRLYSSGITYYTENIEINYYREIDDKLVNKFDESKISNEVTEPKTSFGYGETIVNNCYYDNNHIYFNDYRSYLDNLNMLPYDLRKYCSKDNVKFYIDKEYKNELRDFTKYYQTIYVKVAPTKDFGLINISFDFNISEIANEYIDNKYTKYGSIMSMDEVLVNYPLNKETDKYNGVSIDKITCDGNVINDTLHLEKGLSYNLTLTLDVNL